MGKTTIAWTEHTWNPVRGCSRVSEGCRCCYAERMAARGLPGMSSPTTGEHFAIMTPSGPHWTGKVELIPTMLDIPLRRKRPTTYFVNSMSDLFHESLPDEAIDRVFAVMALCPQHRFRVLTKRAARMREYFGNIPYRQEVIGIYAEAESGVDRFTTYGERAAASPGGICPTWELPFPNVSLGVSVEDQPTADARIPHLLHTPAAVRFVSYEPALGPVDFTQILIADEIVDALRGEWATQRKDYPTLSGYGEPKLDWVIVGGESGPGGARPFDIAWARQTVAQCRAAGVPCFVKQYGAKPFDGHFRLAGLNRRSGEDRLYIKLKDRKGGDPSEWAEDLRVREMPR